ncbi:hypothetical protein BV898_13927 [Hypsibius exemplaris]|uniref:Uncharacterized protein n=1 Tax=Hypsibius exemplaris TaxID=2072580 RepID=A0A1W0W9H5_HYPEX|nr:hypothetical protein BV898_13927 [Hypsibius exemplaris]
MAVLPSHSQLSFVSLAFRLTFFLTNAGAIEAFLVPSGGGIGNALVGPTKLYGLLDILSKVPAGLYQPAGPAGTYVAAATPAPYGDTHVVVKYPPAVPYQNPVPPLPIVQSLVISAAPPTYVTKTNDEKYPKVGQYAVGPYQATTPVPDYGSPDQYTRRPHHHGPPPIFVENNPFPPPPYGNGPTIVNPQNNGYIPPPPGPGPIIGFYPGPGVQLNYNGGQYYGTTPFNNYHGTTGYGSNGYQPPPLQLGPPLPVQTYGTTSVVNPPPVSIAISPVFYVPSTVTTTPCYDKKDSGYGGSHTLDSYQPPVRDRPYSSGQKPSASYGGSGDSYGNNGGGSNGYKKGGSNSYGYGGNSQAYAAIPTIPYPPSVPLPTAFYPSIPSQSGPYNQGYPDGGYGYQQSGGNYGTPGYGNQGSNYGNQGSNYGNQGSNYGSQGSNYGNQGSNYGNQGSNYGNQGGGTYQLVTETGSTPYPANVFISGGQGPYVPSEAFQDYQKPSYGSNVTPDYGGSTGDYGGGSGGYSNTQQYSSGNGYGSTSGSGPQSYDPPNVYQQPGPSVPYDQSGPIDYSGSGGSYGSQGGYGDFPDAKSPGLLTQLNTYGTRLNSNGKLSLNGGGPGGRPFLFTAGQSADLPGGGSVLDGGLGNRQGVFDSLSSSLNSLGTVSDSDAITALAINTLLERGLQGQYPSNRQVEPTTAQPKVLASPSKVDPSVVRWNDFFNVPFRRPIIRLHLGSSEIA